MTGPRILSRRAVTALAALSILAGLAVAAWAAGSWVTVGSDGTATLSPDALVFDSDRTDNYELFVMGTDGSLPTQLTADPRYDSWWPKISPDRETIVFYRTPAGVHDRDFTQTSLWTVGVDGTGLRELIPVGGHGWAMHGHAEFSPDGTELVMFGGPDSFSPQIYITDTDGSNPRQVTDRPGTNIDPSWGTDGALLFIGCPVIVCLPHQYEVYRIRPDGTGEQQLTSDLARDHDPYLAPDGSAIAWLREVPTGYAIFLMQPDGRDQRPLIDTPVINSKPNWSLDSRSIFFHRTPLGRTLFNVFVIDVATRELRELEPRPPIGFGEYDNEFPVNSSH